MFCWPRYCHLKHHAGKCQDSLAHPKSVSKYTLGSPCTFPWRTAHQPGMGTRRSTALLLTLLEIQGTVSRGGSYPPSPSLGVSLGCSQGSSSPLRTQTAHSRAQPLTAPSRSPPPLYRAREQHRNQGLLHLKQGWGDSTWSPIPSPPLEPGISRALLLATRMGQSQVQVLTSSAKQHRYHPLNAAHGAPCAQAKGSAPPKPK